MCPFKMSLYAVECDGSDSGEAPIPVKFAKQESKMFEKVSDSPKRTRKRNSTALANKQNLVKKTETVYDLKHEVIKEKQMVDINAPDSNEINSSFDEIREFKCDDSKPNENFVINYDESDHQSVSEEEEVHVNRKNTMDKSNNVKNNSYDVSLTKNSSKSSFASKEPHITQLSQQDNVSVQETQQKDEGQIDQSPQKKNFPLLFRVTREKVMHFNGRSLYFRLYETEKQLLIAKCKGTRDIVPINSGEIIHMGGSSEYVLVCSTDEKDFGLRRKNRLGEELMTVRFFPRGPRERRGSIITFMSYDDSDENFPEKLTSLDYEMDKEYNDFEIKSVKNAVFVEKGKTEPMLWVRKIGENELSIQAQFNIDPVYCMAIAISSFICKLIE